MSQLLRSALGVVCAACDAYNPPGTERCTACGQSVEGAKDTAPARPSGQPAASVKSPPVVRVHPPQEPTRTPARGPEIVPPGMRPSSRTPAPLAGSAPKTLTPPPVAPPPRQAPSAPRAAPVAAVRPPAGPPVLSPPSQATGAPARVTQPVPLTQPARPAASRTASESAHPAVRAPRTTSESAVPLTKPAQAPSRFSLVVHSRSGQPARYRLPNGATVIGRNRGGLIFPEDAFISAPHATLLIKDGQLFIRDEGSASGVFVAIAGQEAITPGTFFCAGARLFRYAGPLPRPAIPPGQALPYGAPVPSGQALYGLEEILIGGRAGRAITTVGPLVTIGSSGGDFTFANDPGLAPRHIELTPTPSHAVLRDLSGGLGTFVRIAAQLDRPLAPGDRIRVGLQLLQIEAA